MGGGRWEVGGGRWEVGGGRWEVGESVSADSSPFFSPLLTFAYHPFCTVHDSLPPPSPLPLTSFTSLASIPSYIIKGATM